MQRMEEALSKAKQSKAKQSKAKQSKALINGVLFVDPIFGMSCLKERVSRMYILEVF